MPRPRASEPRNQQLLLRLKAAEFEILESIAHLEHTTPNGYVYDLVSAHLGALAASNAHLAADMANRRSYAAGLAETVPIADGRVSPPKSADAEADGFA